MLEAGIAAEKINIMLGLSDRILKMNDSDPTVGPPGSCTGTRGRLARFEISQTSPDVTIERDHALLTSSLRRRDNADVVQYGGSFSNTFQRCPS